MTRAEDDPLTDEEFAHSLNALNLRGAIAVAVSGGCDSVALLDLVAAQSKNITALTVDHGLRPESAQEAGAVGDLARAMGAAHVVLTWQGEKPLSNLEAQARAARYDLLCGWCIQNSVPNLLVAHTLDDQAETVLMRLARGSGVDGLSAMAPRLVRAGITIARPLLDVPRARLEARLTAKGVRWFDDPMNGDAQFLRVRVRQARAVLADLGLTPPRLAATARAMARARAALETLSARLIDDAIAVSPLGMCTVELTTLQDAPDEIALRALASALMGIGGLIYRPRLERLERLYGLLREGALTAGRTLGGCAILPAGQGQVEILREAALIDAAPVPLAPGETRLWDRRFHVTLAADAPSAGEVRPLGDISARLLESLSQTVRVDCPARLRATLPGLWVKDELVAVPLLGLERGTPNYRLGGFAASFEGMRDQKPMAEPPEGGLY